MIEGLPAWAPNLSATGALVLIALFAVTGRLLWHKTVDRWLDDLRDQRDRALKAAEEARQINRLQAEAFHQLSESVDRLADGQDVVATFVRTSLPAPRSDSGLPPV